MMIKYRIREVAKDLGVSNKDIIETLAKYYPEPKKYMTVLNEQELDIILDTFTQENSSADLDTYYARRKKMAHIPEENQLPEETPEPPVTQEKELISIEVADATAPVAPNSNQTKPAVDQEGAGKRDSIGVENNLNPKEKKPDDAQLQRQGQKSPQAQQPAKAPQQGARAPQQATRTPQQGARAQQQPTRTPQQGARAQQQPTRTPQQGARAQQQPTRTPQQGARAPQQPTRTPQQGARAPQQPTRTPQQGARTPQQPTGVPQQPTNPAQQAADPQNAAAQRRLVDTRTSNVNIDKYNEKYDRLADQKVKSDNIVTKQKFTNRNQNRRNQRRGKRETEFERLNRIALERKAKHITVEVPVELTVGDLALRLKVAAPELIKKLMQMGTFVAINDMVDYDTAELVAEEFHIKVEHEVVVTIEDRIIDDSEDDSENLETRAPVVVVMGHVDHGKTSILDAIRDAKVTDGEAGGITQHIGAYRVQINDQDITFLDTPGHAAFTTMRARGAQVTDIAVLVVAADDGIMPQTIEAINHAKAAGVSIIVAVNKMDKPEANPERVKQQLTEHGLVPEEWGGDVPCIPVSAHTHDGINDLLEMILLIADMKELKANPTRAAKGTVVEARLDKGLGPIATILIQNGTLRTGDTIVAGTTVGRVRVMTDDRGIKRDEAGPSVPVEITGLNDAPEGGDIFNVVSDERLARALVEQRLTERKEEHFRSQTKVTLDNLFDQMKDGEMKELKIIVKADVQGSVEAVRQSLEKLSNEEVRVHIIHGAVGAVNESDIMLANASNAIVVGFNVRPDSVAEESAKRDGVDLRLYRIIYDCIEEIESAMKGMLAPKIREVALGKAECREVYKISNIGIVLGSHITSGKMIRNALIRVVRDGIIIADDKVGSLRRFKDDVKEVAEGYDCGITLEKYADIKVGDILEAYEMQEYRED